MNCPKCGKALTATMRSIEKDKLHCPGCKTDLNRDTLREQAQKYLAILDVEVQAPGKACGKAATITPELGIVYRCTDCGTPYLYEELYALTQK